MKFCTNCGKELPENSKFCTSCGMPVRDISITSQNKEKNVNEALNEYQVYRSTKSENRGAQVITSQRTVSGNHAQKAVSSTLYLVAIIANSIYLVLNLFNILTSGIAGTVNNYMRQIQSLMGYSGYYYNYLGMLEGGIKLFSFVLMLPPILFCFGTWIIYMAASGKTSNTGTGFSFARIGIILQLVGSAVLFGIILMACVFVGFASEEIGIVLLSIVVIGGIGALYILFYLKELSSLKTIQNNLENGDIDSLSMYIPIIGFVVGVISVFGLLGVSGFMAVVSALAHIIWIFAASIWMIQYKNY